MSKRIVYTINPNDGKYMRDDDEIIDSSSLYPGKYKFIPIFPLYTMKCEIFDYFDQVPKVSFRTMLPIKRWFKHYLVEVRIDYTVNILEKNSYIILIDRFNLQCDELISTINPTKLCQKERS